MLRKLFYRFPFLVSGYHFLWAFFGKFAYRSPGKNPYIIGITGTKGKTTTVELVNAILEAAGKKTAVLSSLHIKIGDENKKNPSGNSMPGRGFIQKFLRDAAGAGCSYAVIEVTSQGVVQSRHKFVDWKIGALTNLAPEHIEAHRSFENYRAAKLGFLKYVKSVGGLVFLNRDDKSFEYFNEKLGNQTVAYSKNDEDLCSMFPREVPMHSVSKKIRHALFLSEFNLENIALAASIAKQIGIDVQTVKSALENFKGVPGRMNVVIENPFFVVVDYAHTPDSLKAVYAALRKELREGNKLIAVLGAAGGGRDKWKRPEMGRIAGEFCQKIVLTDEDPYDEDPEEIIREIKNGVLEGHFANDNLFVIPDRHEAIAMALSLASPGDIVVCTGKGSESWIHLAKGKKIPWDEQAAVLAAFQKVRKEL